MFVCDGSPLTCDIFIVGVNAATDTPFWPYWDDATGFNKLAWERAYLEARQARGKTGPSNTRRRIDLIVGTAAPVRCLETNAFATASPSLAKLDRDARVSATFDFLARAIQRLVPTPRTIFERHLAYVGYARAAEIGRELREMVSSTAGRSSG